MFRELLEPRPGQRILDLGSDDGSHIASILDFRDDVYIADISAAALARGRERYGFETLLLDENGRIPVEDGWFDTVFCSSVIEHVSVDKERAEQYKSQREFSREALAHQRRFADEIRRVGKRYFVQTPNRYFPIESHTWLPGVIVLLPRRLQIALIRRLNSFWPKTTSPDWNLLTARQMQELFPEAQIVRERSLGMTKSIIAVRS